jgi:hypothetical protein
VVGHLVDLITESWWDLDAHAGERFHEYFAKEGVFDFAGRITSGRDRIRELLAQRRQEGARTTVHLLSNFVAEVRHDVSATVRSYICVFGADGEPLQETSRPNLIGYMQDEFEHDPQEGWLIVRRTFRPVLYNGDDRVARGVAEL